MSWFDDNGIPTSSAPTAGAMAGPGGSLGTLAPSPTSGAPTAGTAAGPGVPTGGGSYGNLSDPSAWMGLVGNQSQLTQWVQQQNPNLSPGLVQYYASKIQGQPGANPTEQAGSANYWMQKIQSDPTTGGGAQGGSAGGGNASGIPGLDPGFNFQVGQAQQAIQRSAASKGTLLTGGTLKGLADYIGNDMASSAYQGAFGRSLSLANLGESAAAGQGANNSGYATNAANTITGGANAQGAAGIAQGNIANNSLSNLGTLGLYGSGLNPANVNGTASSYQQPASWATQG
jgi:hypothetical protein